jgi:hypothetical protein
MKGGYLLRIALLITEAIRVSKDFLPDYFSFCIKSYYCRSLYYSEIETSIKVKLNALLL